MSTAPRFVSPLLLALLATTAAGQGFPATRPADDQGVHIIKPAVDAAAGKVSLPGAFWNQRLADWLEVAFCGRPSDFLHETLTCATTTRTELETALRQAGFHDADAWAASINDFTRIRGDRLMVLVQFTRPNGTAETYSLDELLSYQGWNIAVGPYGFMFKGDPERATATAPAAAPGAVIPEDAPDSVSILRDDPQIALSFRGLQSMSQSFADHPLAYSEWIYPMMEFGRNTSVLSPEIFNSNGALPVTLIFQKVTEEQLLTESAKVWHDPGWREVILKQLPVAKEIDANKQALWAMRDAIARQTEADRHTDGLDATFTLRNAAALRAKIAAGYATLDAAWGASAAERARFVAEDPRMLAGLKEQAAKWREHLELKKIAAEQRVIIAEIDAAPGKPPAQRQPAQVEQGRSVVARAIASRAENQQARDYWKNELARLDPINDPRTDWIKSVRLQVELADARHARSNADEALGMLLIARQQGAELERAARHAADLQVRVRLLETRLDLAAVEFEISKRETFPDDPDLPSLRKKKADLESLIQSLVPTTRSGQ